MAEITVSAKVEDIFHLSIDMERPDLLRSLYQRCGEYNVEDVVSCVPREAVALQATE